MDIIQQLEQEEIKRLGKNVPDFAPGDTVVVNVNVVEGERKRVQAFEGLVIAKRTRGLKVPEMLMSGHHENIRRWRLKQALGRTWLRRPELIEARSLSEEEKNLLEEFRREHQKPDESGARK